MKSLNRLGFGIAGLCLWIAPLATPASGATVFSDDFSGQTVKPQWSSSTATLGVNTAPSGQRFLGRSGTNSSLSNDAVRLTVPGLIPGNATLRFDLFIIRSMDGVEPFAVTAPDGETSLLVTSFSNLLARDYPAATQDFPTAQSLPTTGASAIGTLGYSLVNPTHVSDSTYHLAMTFAYVVNNTGALGIDFKYSDLQGISDESWGIDNVKLEATRAVVPIPAAAVLLAPGLGLLAILKRRAVYQDMT